jgi:hypothetical protein
MRIMNLQFSLEGEFSLIGVVSNSHKNACIMRLRKRSRHQRKFLIGGIKLPTETESAMLIRATLYGAPLKNSNWFCTVLLPTLLTTRTYGRTLDGCRNWFNFVRSDVCDILRFVGL